MIDRPERAGIVPLSFRLLALLAPLLLATAVNAHPARAAGPVPVERARFVGQVTAVSTTAGNPTQFSLQALAQSVDITITPQTNFVAMSAEANVEGLVRNDYAVVSVKRVKAAWVAVRITYDVEPVPPLRTVVGTILRVGPDGRRLYMKLDTGPSRWVAFARLTRFRLDGRLLDSPPVLVRGEAVQLVVQNTIAGWVALEVDLRSSPLLERR